MRENWFRFCRPCHSRYDRWLRDHKLSLNQISDIKQRAIAGTSWKNPGNTTELAKEFGVTNACIRQIARGYGIYKKYENKGAID